MTKQPQETRAKSSSLLGPSPGSIWVLVARALFGLTLTIALVVGHQVGPAAAQSVTEIIDEIEQSGSYLELSASGLDEAVAAAEREGIAFVWLERSGSESESSDLADALVDELESRNSSYSTTLVLFADSYGASSSTIDQPRLDDGLDAALDGFGNEDQAEGLSAFVSAAVGFTTSPPTTGGLATNPPTTNSPTTNSPTVVSSGSTEAAPGQSSGGGVGPGTILLIGAAGAGVALLFRRWRKSKKSDELSAFEMEQDRSEIKEQLRDNADKIMSLGDQVILKGDHELIASYEEASQTYQQVSQSIDSASTAAEIDVLDDRIDHAEWQLESIEAELEGRPAPPQPLDEDKAVLPPPSASDRTGPSPAATADAERARSAQSNSRTSRPGRSGQGNRFGGLGGILGSILIGVLSNGGLSGGSRRSQRRRSGFGSGGMGGSIGTSRRSSGGSLGRGGVLSRGGSRRRSGGSRSLGGRSRSSGGRKL